jgi:creatinine amidohydrolase
MATMLLIHPVFAQASRDSVYVEDLTWTELKSRLQSGADTVLIPIGGTEQNGPHMVLGKHNVRVRVLAGRIAARLGRAVVAPVLAYVPEGSINPPSAHMRFTGTISIRPDTFEALLASGAESFRQHGFRHIIFLGDHGSYQGNLKRVATRLNGQWGKSGAAKAIALTDYYDVAQEPFNALLRQQGFSAEEVGSHAGLADTSLTLAVDPDLVRVELLPQAARAGPRQGVAGDPTRSSARLGEGGLQLIVENSVKTLRRLMNRP